MAAVMGIISRQGLRIEAHCKNQPNNSLALVTLATLQQKTIVFS